MGLHGLCQTMYPKAQPRGGRPRIMCQWPGSMPVANTVFALLDAAATIYFARQFGAASIGERLLIESGVY